MPLHRTCLLQSIYRAHVPECIIKISTVPAQHLLHNGCTTCALCSTHISNSFATSNARNTENHAPREPATRWPTCLRWFRISQSDGSATSRMTTERARLPGANLLTEDYHAADRRLFPCLRQGTYFAYTRPPWRVTAFCVCERLCARVCAYVRARTHACMFFLCTSALRQLRWLRRRLNAWIGRLNYTRSGSAKTLALPCFFYWWHDQHDQANEDYDTLFEVSEWKEHCTCAYHGNWVRQSFPLC